MTNPAQRLTTVAVADDESSIRLALKLLIQKSGYTFVGEAEDGRSAVELVKQTKPQLILLDVHMPGMDGLEATELIVKLGTTAVVLLTGDPSLDLPHRAMDLGACGFLAKPFEGVEVRAMIESAWHRFQAIAQLRGEILVLNETLETRKLVEKAKGILMEQQGLSEEKAHQILQKMSQDQGISLKDVCRSVIQVKMVLGKLSQRKAV